MTNDASYQPGVVQHRQDGDIAVVTGTTLVVETGGGLKVESGGALTVNSGGTLTVASGGIVTVAGVLGVPVETGTTTAAFAPFGLTLINDTAANTYTLAQPSAAGLSKTITSINHGATTVAVAVNTVGAKILGATTVLAGTSVITFLSNGSVKLVSSSTVAWAVDGYFTGTNVAFT